MIRVFIVILVVLILFPAIGYTLDDAMAVDQTKNGGHYEPKPELTSYENHMLQTWNRAAIMAEGINDYATSILFYTKIVEYFPKTEEGIKAKKQLKKLNKSCKAKEEVVAE